MSLPGLSEAEILQTILNYLTLKRIFHFRNNTGAIAASYKGKERFIRFGTPGNADIILCHEGRFIALEVKSPQGKQSDTQKIFEANLRQAGGYYFICRSLDDALDALITLGIS